MLCGLGLAFSFIKYARALSYNRVNVTYVNYI